MGNTSPKSFLTLHHLRGSAQRYVPLQYLYISLPKKKPFKHIPAYATFFFTKTKEYIGVVLVSLQEKY